MSNDYHCIIVKRKSLIRYTLSASDGFAVALIDYGATIQSIQQIDKNNQIAEITLGYDNLQGRFEFENESELFCPIRLC